MADTVPSLSHLAQRLASFDAEIIDMLELELLKDSGSALGKKSFFKTALDQLNLFARKNLVAETFVHDARAFLAVTSILLGDFPALREEQMKEALAEAQSFKPKNPTANKQVKAATLYIRSRFSSLRYGSQLVLCYLIHNDEKLSQSYTRLFFFYEKIHGRADSLLSLVPLLPISLSAASVATVPIRTAQFFPSPKSYQLLPLAKDYGENWLKNIELGKVLFRPNDRSGWFEYQKYAYQALVNSGAADDSSAQEDTRASRCSTIFRQFMAGTPVDLFENDQYLIPIFYERLARSYAFLYDLIMTTFPQEQRNLRRKSKTTHLIAELKQMIRVFYGLARSSEENSHRLHLREAAGREKHLPIDIMKAHYNLKTDAFSQICEANPERCYQACLNWELFLP